MASPEARTDLGLALLGPEDTFGQNKRFDFVATVIAAAGARRILDVGCGTGALLTTPLARRFPEASFLGLDTDGRTVAHANATNRLSNLRFVLEGGGQIAGPFDLIIASEVIEHVEAPEEFLRGLVRRLAPDGRLVVTVPNGYGPSELVSFVHTVLLWSGLFPMLRGLWRAVRPARSPPAAGAESPCADTLADSPHLSFFSYGAIRRVFAASGLRVERYRARMFLCGFAVSNIVSGLGLVRWNLDVAERLAPALVSDWMFVLARDPAGPIEARPYRRSRLARLRRRLNERVWGGG